MSELLIQIIVPVVTALVGGFSSWFFTRRKYNVEIKSMEADVTDKVSNSIQNSYIELNKNLELKIDKLSQESIDNWERIEKQQKEIMTLSSVITEMIRVTCCEAECTKRRPMTTDKVNELIDKLNFGK